MGSISDAGSAALARLVCVLGKAPAALPSSKGYERWILENPLPLTALFVLAGLLMWFVMRGKGRAKEGAWIAAAFLVLGAIVMGTGMLVQTEREVLTARSHVLVDAVATVNVAKVSGMLAGDVVVAPFGFGKDMILRRLESDLGGMYAIKEHRVLEAVAAIDGPNSARTQVHVRATPDEGLYNAPVGSWWMLHWRKDGKTGEWMVTQLELQQMDGVGSVDSIRP